MFGSMCLVFVFKQKTAYEMRISDWSSDVCSSDLLALDHVGCCRAEPVGQEDVSRSSQDGKSLGVQLAAARRRGGHDLVGSSHLLGLEVFDTVAWIRYSTKPLGTYQLSHSPQIGRASCRERVCPYV